MTNQQKVTEFMLAADEPVRSEPGFPSYEHQELRQSLIDEEFAELRAALDFQDLEGVADAIGDLLYVVYGTAAAFGLDAQGIFDEVHRSNMTKFIDGYRRPDGKWMKGPSFSPPDLKKFLK